jgi:hypothetical protein
MTCEVNLTGFLVDAKGMGFSGPWTLGGLLTNLTYRYSELGFTERSRAAQAAATFSLLRGYYDTVVPL